MPYVDLAYFTDTYLGTWDGTPQEFAKLERRASEMIDMYTMHKIPLKGGLDKFKPFIQEQVKKAVCAQIEYLDAMGGWDELVDGQLGGNGAVRLGSFSYGGGASGGGSGDARQQSWGDNISQFVKPLLAPTGLLYRGVRVGDHHHLPFGGGFIG